MTVTGILLAEGIPVLLWREKSTERMEEEGPDTDGQEDSERAEDRGEEDVCGG